MQESREKSGRGELRVKRFPDRESKVLVTCSSFPGIGEEGGVVLDLVGKDGGAVVSSRLPHHAGVLAVALDPEQFGGIGHVLNNQ